MPVALLSGRYTQGQAPLATERRGSAAASSLVDQVEVRGPLWVHAIQRICIGRR